MQGINKHHNGIHCLYLGRWIILFLDKIINYLHYSNRMFVDDSKTFFTFSTNSDSTISSILTCSLDSLSLSTNQTHSESFRQGYFSFRILSPIRSSSNFLCSLSNQKNASGHLAISLVFNLSASQEVFKFKHWKSFVLW